MFQGRRSFKFQFNSFISYYTEHYKCTVYQVVITINKFINSQLQHLMHLNLSINNCSI